MANSLLDFVLSLVRDPSAAAAYAADPARAIADAHLTDVTSVDVNNLIPVVSDSLSVALPGSGGDAFGADPSGNVWASGAATAAFDAFDMFDPSGGSDPSFEQGGFENGGPGDDSPGAVAIVDTDPGVIDDSPLAGHLADPAGSPMEDPSSQFSDLPADDFGTGSAWPEHHWDLPDADTPHGHTPGFDHFD